MLRLVFIFVFSFCFGTTITVNKCRKTLRYDTVARTRSESDTDRKTNLECIHCRLQLTSPPTDGVSGLAFSPAADFLAVSSWDNQVRREQRQRLLISKDLLTIVNDRSGYTKYSRQARPFPKLHTRMKRPRSA